jgi:pyridoxal phosphate-dependent aminotransferase EpsN
VSSLTFSATVNAIRYVGGLPVFIDADEASWNMDPDLLGEALGDGDYAACIPVDIYGQCADYDRILPLCEERGVPVIEDAAEALGATHRERPAGSFGDMAVLSFNGNKIITTSGGGALFTDDADWAERARFLATQARDPAPHYQHSQIGYNYRLSNLLAALGRSQLSDLDRRVDTRRAHNAAYREALGGTPGVSFMPESPGCRSTFWLTCLTIDPQVAGVSRDDVRLHLETLDIESRPVWKPMHLQPIFEKFDVYGGDISTRLFDRGLCLPSGSSLTDQQRDRVVAGIREFIVFCGVRFMASTARILAQSEQVVVHPTHLAGCPMADMADIEPVVRVLNAHARPVPPHRLGGVGKRLDRSVADVNQEKFDRWLPGYAAIGGKSDLCGTGFAEGHSSASPPP